MIAPSQFWAVRKDGTTVKKYDTVGETRIPEDIATHNTFNILSIEDRSSLESEPIDRSVLSNDEKQMLSITS